MEKEGYKGNNDEETRERGCERTWVSWYAFTMVRHVCGWVGGETWALWMWSREKVGVNDARWLRSKRKVRGVCQLPNRIRERRDRMRLNGPDVE